MKRNQSADQTIDESALQLQYKKHKQKSKSKKKPKRHKEDVEDCDDSDESPFSNFNPSNPTRQIPEMNVNIAERKLEVNQEETEVMEPPKIRNLQLPPFKDVAHINFDLYAQQIIQDSQYTHQQRIEKVKEQLFQEVLSLGDNIIDELSEQNQFIATDSQQSEDEDCDVFDDLDNEWDLTNDTGLKPQTFYGNNQKTHTDFDQVTQNQQYISCLQPESEPLDLIQQDSYIEENHQLLSPTFQQICEEGVDIVQEFQQQLQSQEAMENFKLIFSENLKKPIISTGQFNRILKKITRTVKQKKLPYESIEWCKSRLKEGICAHKVSFKDPVLATIAPVKIWLSNDCLSLNYQADKSFNLPWYKKLQFPRNYRLDVIQNYMFGTCSYTFRFLQSKWFLQVKSDRIQKKCPSPSNIKDLNTFIQQAVELNNSIKASEIITKYQEEEKVPGLERNYRDWECISLFVPGGSFLRTLDFIIPKTNDLFALISILQENSKQYELTVQQAQQSYKWMKFRKKIAYMAWLKDCSIKDLFQTAVQKTLKENCQLALYQLNYEIQDKSLLESNLFEAYKQYIEQSRIEDHLSLAVEYIMHRQREYQYDQQVKNSAKSLLMKNLQKTLGIILKEKRPLSMMTYEKCQDRYDNLIELVKIFNKKSEIKVSLEQLVQNKVLFCAVIRHECSVRLLICQRLYNMRMSKMKRLLNQTCAQMTNVQAVYEYLTEQGKRLETTFHALQSKRRILAAKKTCDLFDMLRMFNYLEGTIDKLLYHLFVDIALIRKDPKWAQVLRHVRLQFAADYNKMEKASTKKLDKQMSKKQMNQMKKQRSKLRRAMI